MYVCVHNIGEVCKVSLTQSCKTDAHSKHGNLNISHFIVSVCIFQYRTTELYSVTANCIRFHIRF